MSTNGISLSNLAQRLGVTEGAIRKAIKTGRIPPDAVSKYKTKSGKTRPVISDPGLAAHSFTHNTDHTRSSNYRPLDAEADEGIKKLRHIREQAWAQVDVARARKAVGETISRSDARQRATMVIHTELKNLRATVRGKRLTKHELLAAINACEIAVMDALEKRFAPNDDDSSI
jgi:hypothetical protein